MAVLGLRFCARAFSSCGKWGPLFIAVRGASHYRGLSRRAGSVIVTHGPSCSVACGIFPDQGSNPCPLHWQSDSQPLHHQGSPWFGFNCNTTWPLYHIQEGLGNLPKGTQLVHSRVRIQTHVRLCSFKKNCGKIYIT